MTLREEIDEAIEKLEMYKHPNIEDVEAKLSAILMARNDNTLKYHSIYEMYSDSSILLIYVKDGYDGEVDLVTIPMSIIESDDPVFEMRKQYLIDMISGTELVIRSNESSLIRARERLETQKLELEQHLNSKESQ